MKKSKIPTFVVLGAIVVSFVLLAVGRGGGPGLPATLPHNAGGAIVSESVQGGSQKTEARPAPDFTLTTLEGQQLTLSSYKNKKPVILDFFATWCPNCRRDIPKESALYRKYDGQIEVIGINLQENPNTVAKFANEYDIPFPVVLDPRGLASRIYGVRYTNFHILIDKEGNLVRFVPGDIRESDFTSLL